MVLADDNFASIAHAVEEGRTIYDNLRKAIVFILATNGAQALTITVAVLMGEPLPITAAQVLWGQHGDGGDAIDGAGVRAPRSGHHGASAAPARCSDVERRDPVAHRLCLGDHPCRRVYRSSSGRSEAAPISRRRARWR